MFIPLGHTTAQFHLLVLNIFTKKKLFQNIFPSLLFHSLEEVCSSFLSFFSHLSPHIQNNQDVRKMYFQRAN